MTKLFCAFKHVWTMTQTALRHTIVYNLCFTLSNKLFKQNTLIFALFTQAKSLLIGP